MRPQEVCPDAVNNKVGLPLTRRHLGRAALFSSAFLLARDLMAQTASNPSLTPASLALPKARSLPEELAIALAKGRPLVVMVSLNGCPYCKIARENYLLPLVRQDAISVVQVDMLTKSPVLDFQGQATTHEQLVDKWRVQIAPTLLFFGKAGAEKAERLVGGYLPDFYGAYLQDRLSAAQKSL